ncbi:hypothetical protein [Lacibacter sp. H407]|uniref:hypothetical protein n=1 Tax=Lacibacter sp. H407 TaxID=3133423 RepID=UPI0030BAE191
MNLDYKHLLPADFAADSRVWVYQSSRLFSLGEALQIEDLLNHFVENWKSHGTPVKGFGTLFFGQFILLMADERATGVSGCSTDSSVRLIKEIEQLYKVSMFDRQNLAFIIKEKIELLPLGQLQYAFDNGFIKADTVYINNLVQTKEELENNWLIPVKESWLAKRIRTEKQEKAEG